MTTNDTGLAALVSLLRLQGVAAEPAQLHHQLGLAGKPVGVVEMLRCAHQLGLKARSLSTRWARLARTPLPGIAELRDGSFLLVGKATADKVLVHVPGRSEVMTKQQFEEAWTGRLVLMRRARLGDVARRFDIGWFAGALNKYRGLLGEVLLASFFLQLFALLTPLFFQVVIDKVLVHQPHPLEVVMVAIVGFAIAETLLGIMRTYLFAHTTNRVDVELGARLFRHLMALPLSYFQSRRVGDSVARVRELENIRVFLTSSALTLVLDLFFTLVFVGVMFFYSPSAQLDRHCRLSLLHRDLDRRGALFRRLDEKFRRGAENVPGRERRGRRDRQGDGSRTADAAALGGPARQLRLGQLPRAQPRQHDQRSVQRQAGQCRAALRRQARHRRQPDDRRTGRLHHDRQPALPCCAWLGSGRTSTRPGCPSAPGDILNTPTEPTYAPGRAALHDLEGNIVFDHVNFRYRPDGQRVLEDVSSLAAGRSWASSAFPVRARARSPS